MLNITKLNDKINKIVKTDRKVDDMGSSRYYPSANREWYNSIYEFNKNVVKSLPTSNKVTNKLIRGYFNLFSRKLERKLRIPKKRLRFRRSSVNRMLVSKIELKHISDIVIINVYVYNRQTKYYFKKMMKKAKRAFFVLKRKRVGRKIRLVKFKSLKVLRRVKMEKNLLLKTLGWSNNNFINYDLSYYKFFIKRSLRKEMLYTYYKQIKYVSNTKFRNIYLTHLKSLIEKIYLKKVEFNIVKLKYIHLDSSIFTNLISVKLRDRKNRIFKVLKRFFRKIRISYVDNLDILANIGNKKIHDFKIKNVFNSNTENKAINKNTLESVANNILPTTLQKKPLSVGRCVLDSVKHKLIDGIRVEGSGRLTKRLTAQKAIHKVRYKGNLRNKDSTYKKLSSTILIGHKKSNVQNTKLNSKGRLGSFGLKGWLSSN